jgi:hypothetical protein
MPVQFLMEQSPLAIYSHHHRIKATPWELPNWSHLVSAAYATGEKH